MIMKKELNIAAILKDKQNVELYDLLHNISVKLDNISTTNGITTIWCKRDLPNKAQHFGYTELGTERGWLDGLQILKPSKLMRDWSKFAWKKGDVLVYIDGEEPYYAIFEEFQDDEYTAFKSRYNYRGGNHWLQFNSQSSTNYFAKASDDEAKEFIKKIEEHYEGKLNLSTLEIQKQPEFKEGKVWNSDTKQLEDLPKKCEFKPMDWCLMRDRNETWKLCQLGFFYGDYEATYNAVGGNWFDECIPYNEDTKHLLGTTDEWKGNKA